jgi:hypothetical protein
VGVVLVDGVGLVAVPDVPGEAVVLAEEIASAAPDVRGEPVAVV